MSWLQLHQLHADSPPHGPGQHTTFCACFCCMLPRNLMGCSTCNLLRCLCTAGCKRKFDVKGYIKLIGDMVAKIKAKAKAKA